MRIVFSTFHGQNKKSICTKKLHNISFENHEIYFDFLAQNRLKWPTKWPPKWPLKWPPKWPPYFLIKGNMFNDFCNSFRAQQTFSNLINFVCIFNISLHILFCRIFYFIVATHLELSFYQLRPYIYSFCQFFQALHVFFLPNFLGSIYSADRQWRFGR